MSHPYCVECWKDDHAKEKADDRLARTTCSALRDPAEAPRTMASTRKELVAAGLQKPELLKKDREKTPPAFAAWLVEVARICRGNK